MWFWLHNNKEIRPSKDFQYTNEANIYKLQIAEIFPEDAGTYTCEAFNDAGESFSTCTIGVVVPGEEDATTFTVFPSSATIQECETGRFVCETNDEVLNLNWFKDAKLIDNENCSRYNFTKDNNTYIFEITNSQSSDAGQYQAKAIGKKNETFAAFSVNVFTTE